MDAILDSADPKTTLASKIVEFKTIARKIVRDLSGSINRSLMVSLIAAMIFKIVSALYISKPALFGYIAATSVLVMEIVEPKISITIEDIVIDIVATIIHQICLLKLSYAALGRYVPLRDTHASLTKDLAEFLAQSGARSLSDIRV